jgi:hypothetical protein
MTSVTEVIFVEETPDMIPQMCTIEHIVMEITVGISSRKSYVDLTFQTLPDYTHDRIDNLNETKQYKRHIKTSDIVQIEKCC